MQVGEQGTLADIVRAHVPASRIGSAAIQVDGDDAWLYLGGQLVLDGDDAWTGPFTLEKSPMALEVCNAVQFTDGRETFWILWPRSFPDNPADVQAQAIKGGQ